MIQPVLRPFKHDIVLTSSLEKHIEQVIKAYENNTISEKTINTAAKRVLAWKLKYLYKMDIKPKDNPTDVYNEDSDEILYIILGVGIVLITLIITEKYIYDLLLLFKK